LPGATLMPAWSRATRNIFLHAYDETAWNDQVLHEGLALRTARAVNHLPRHAHGRLHHHARPRHEGAGYADVELKQAVEQASFPVPACSPSRAPSSPPELYGPKGFALEWPSRKGAEEASGVRHHTRGARPDRPPAADWVQALRRTTGGARFQGPRPPFCRGDEGCVDTARSAGVPVAVHATHARRHAPRHHGRRGNQSSTATAALRKSSSSWWSATWPSCPTLAATEATAQFFYNLFGGGLWGKKKKGKKK